MKSLFFSVPDGKKEELSTRLWEAGTLGVIDDERGLQAFFDDDADTSAFAAERPIIEHCTNSQVYSFQQTGWDAITVGERFFIAPPWVSEPTPPGRIRLNAGAGTAFGTGRHETTQLMLEVMERYVTEAETVLDIGSGSGILSVAALHLGAGQVIACDIHLETPPDAEIPTFIGSADALRSRSADLVLANTSATVLDRLAGELKRITKPAGKLLISGFVRENPPKLFRPLAVTERDEWQCWVCDRAGINADLPAGSTVHIHDPRWW